MTLFIEGTVAVSPAGLACATGECVQNPLLSLNGRGIGGVRCQYRSKPDVAVHSSQANATG